MFGTSLSYHSHLTQDVGEVLTLGEGRIQLQLIFICKDTGVE